MAQINLLPWREERRQELKKDFLVTVGLVLALGVGLVALGDRIVNGRSRTRTRNQYLADNIKVLDEQVAEIRELQKKRNQLLDRMRVIQELQGNRPIIVRVLTSWCARCPTVCSIPCVQTSDKNHQHQRRGGVQQSGSSLMRRLDASDRLANPKSGCRWARPGVGDQANTFNLTVQIQAPATEKRQGGLSDGTRRYHALIARIR